MIIWSVLSVYFDLLTLSPRSVVGTVVFDNLPITGQNWRDCAALYNADADVKWIESKLLQIFPLRKFKVIWFFPFYRQFVVIGRCLESGSRIGCHISWDHLTIKTQKYTNIHILNLKRRVEFMILTVSLCNSYLCSSKYRAEIWIFRLLTNGGSHLGISCFHEKGRSSFHVNWISY